MLSAPANPAPLPASAPAGRPVIGLALEGGGALGIAHVGVLQWMEEHHIPIDRIAGTSMGSLVGGLYASGVSPAQLRALATSDAFTGVFTLQTPYSDLSYRRRQDRRDIPDSLTLGLRNGLQARNGLLSDRGVNGFLDTNMSAYNSHELDFNSMPIPFRCVATDLNTLHSVTFASGPLPTAIRASISIPGVFSPVKDAEGHYLADGGILDNLPTDVLKRDLGADIVIAVHLKSDVFSNSDIGSVLGVLSRAFSAGIEQNVEQSESLATVLIVVPLDSYSTTDYNKGGQLIREGYLAAQANSAALLRYALNDQDWAAYLAARQARIHPQPGNLLAVKVAGGSPGATHIVQRDTAPLAGQPISPAAIISALSPVQSNGVYSATFQTYTPSPTGSQPSAPSNSASGGAAIPDTGIQVRLTKDTIGPPYLIVSPELVAETSNITRMGLDLRVVDQNLGGYGSEARGTAEVGYRTALEIEYYRLLTPRGFFLQPTAGVLRQPVYLWENQKRVAERFQQNLSAGLQLGRTFGNSAQLSATWSALDTRWALRTGSGGPYITGTAQTGLLRIDIDRAASGTLSPSGYRFSASAGAFYHAVSSANSPLAQLSFSRTLSLGADNILAATGEINSYLRANVAQPFRFTLGGPMRLSASSFDEFRGTDTYLARAGYLHRIAALPTGLGQGLYAVFGYEAGEIWSPEQHAILRQDGTTGVIASTPVGVVSVGVSVGDAGHRKVFVTLGRLF
jgi:NTE family protein